jgi:hypothetical protein
MYALLCIPALSSTSRLSGLQTTVSCQLQTECPYRSCQSLHDVVVIVFGDSKVYDNFSVYHLTDLQVHWRTPQMWGFECLGCRSQNREIVGLG